MEFDVPLQETEPLADKINRGQPLEESVPLTTCQDGKVLRDKEVAMIHAIDPGMPRVGDAPSKQEQRRRRNRMDKDTEGEGEEIQIQVSLNSEVAHVTLDLVA